MTAIGYPYNERVLRERGVDCVGFCGDGGCCCLGKHSLRSVLDALFVRLLLWVILFIVVVRRRFVLVVIVFW